MYDLQDGRSKKWKTDGGKTSTANGYGLQQGTRHSMRKRYTIYGRNAEIQDNVPKPVDTAENDGQSMIERFKQP